MDYCLHDSALICCKCIPLLLQESAHLDQRTHLPLEAPIEQQEQAEEDVEEEEEEEDYELEQADLIREAAVLDDMAKLITVEEVCALSFYNE